MRFRMVAFVAFGLAASVSLHAQEPLPPDTTRAAEAAIGNDILALRYFTPGPLSGFKNSLNYEVLFTTDREFIGSAAWLFNTDLATIPRLSFNVGPKLYAAWLNGVTKTQVLAVALGANVRYELIPSMGVAVWGSGFYSPSIITFGSAQNLYDFMAGAEVRFTPQLIGLAGYRWLKFTLELQPSDRVSNQVFAGLRWQFR